jgi:hypothetical protein
MKVNDLINALNWKVRVTWKARMTGEEIEEPHAGTKEWVEFRNKNIYMIFPDTEGNANHLNVSIY